ncbi:glycosyltransferase family 2 protein [Streptomyces sp. AK02-01A]|uniref:glycosyltransferase family 2 protein n=1 Tax=Streptomyces sp. AK02-01A TaxID=3028648 RepID=UPI0029AD26E6|nr:glycosyltransferase [Streptomyces sp. AK02-01A]MDX3855670.1 glycosyltransferase [Streptomyces sp. AK02-01A]
MTSATPCNCRPLVRTWARTDLAAFATAVAEALPTTAMSPTPARVSRSHSPGGSLPRHVRPEITIVIATQLRPERLTYLTELHASLTRQTVPWEAVLVLDGADPTHVPAPLRADSRVRVLPLPRPVGAAAARNLGLSTVSTPYVCYSDDDDLLSDDSLDVRYRRITETGLGWVAGLIADLHPNGASTLWHCPAPAGIHQPGDVTTYWSSPGAQIPMCQTMLLARTSLIVAAGGHGGLPQGEDLIMVTGVTSLAAGELIPHVVYFYRKHPGQMTAGPDFQSLEEDIRRFAFEHGRQLRATLSDMRAAKPATPCLQRESRLTRIQA